MCVRGKRELPRTVILSFQLSAFQSWDLHQVKPEDQCFVCCLFRKLMYEDHQVILLLCVSQAPAEKGGASAGTEKDGTTKEVGQSIFLAQLEVQF